MQEGWNKTTAKEYNVISTKLSVVLYYPLKLFMPLNRSEKTSHYSTA